MKAQRTIVQLVLLNDTGDSYYRMRWPAAQLAEFEPSWRIINLAADARERFEWAEKADLLVLYQSADLDLLPLIRARRAAGRKTLAEYNDNFYAPQAWSPVAEEWSSPLLWQRYELLMRESDGVIVTGPGLLELFSSKVPSEKIHIIENLFPFVPQPFEEIFPRSREITLGWGGSLGHMADFLAVAPILREVLDEAPGLRLRVMGNKAIPELTRFPRDRFEFIHWGSVQEYFQFWKAAQLGIAPLLDTPYNRCRSDIKAVEMSALGVLPLLPDLLPYRQFIAETGIKPFRNFHELKERIAEYVMRPERIEEETRRCYEYVCAKRLARDHRARLQLYAQQIGGKAQKFDWPVDAGYHEINGTPQEKPHYQEALAVADGFLKLRQPHDALATIDRLLQTHYDNPDLVLARLKVLKSMSDRSLHETLQEAERRFPEDLRFALLHVQCSRSADEVLSVWQQILTRLRAGGSRYQDFFRASLLKLFLHVAQASPELFLPTGEALVGLYAEAAELRLFLAQIYEARGEQQLALSHYRWLREAHRTATTNQNIWQSLESGYLAAWNDALEARVRGS